MDLTLLPGASRNNACARKWKSGIANGPSQIWLPSWTHIEPCASLHSRSFGGCSSKPETYQLRHKNETYQTICLSPDMAFLQVIEQVGAVSDRSLVSGRRLVGASCVRTVHRPR